MKAKIISIKENRLTFYALVLGIILSFVFYMYCIDLTVRNGVAHNDIEARLDDLRNEVSDLEYRYTALQNSVTMESGNAFGLVEPESKIFISRSSQKQLSLNN